MCEPFQIIFLIFRIDYLFLSFQVLLVGGSKVSFSRVFDFEANDLNITEDGECRTR